jgi:hypothetical protein
VLMTIAVFTAVAAGGAVVRVLARRRPAQVHV